MESTSLLEPIGGQLEGKCVTDRPPSPQCDWPMSRFTKLADTHGTSNAYANGNQTMSDTFEKRIRAASEAGWWTLLVAAGFLLIMWIIYLPVMNAQPAWLLSLCGRDITWAELQHLWLRAIVALKFCIWLFAFVVTWLTLWSRQLRKQG